MNTTEAATSSERWVRGRLLELGEALIDSPKVLATVTAAQAIADLRAVMRSSSDGCVVKRRAMPPRLPPEIPNAAI